LHVEERDSLYYFADTLRAFKSRTLRQAGYTVPIREIGNAQKILVRKPLGKRPPTKRKLKW
jgi:hypothetical protein